MRGLLLLALAVLTPLSAAASVPPPRDTKAPILAIRYAPPPAGLTCAEGAPRLVEGAPIPPRAWQIWMPPPVAHGGPPNYKPPPLPTSEAFGFSVDADGRVADLKRIGQIPNYGPEDEAGAIIASWRFAPGQAAKGCKIDLAPTHRPIEEATPATLFEMLANDVRNPAPALRKALASAGDCTRAPYRRPNVVVYADLRPFDNKTVDPAWVGLHYDIDADGAVKNVRIMGQHGERAFADAAASAVAEGRFFPGAPRTGCYVAFKAMPKATEAIKRPPGDSFERPTDGCKVTREALNIPENKYFPPAYAKRRVAGWAIVRFDVAPWGQVGAVEVLAAQPAGAFGDAARSLVQSARPSPPPTGYRGCIVPVIYAIPSVAEDGY